MPKSEIKKKKIKHINELNNDCLNLIFAHLLPFREQVRIERVCKRWKSIIESRFMLINDTAKLSEIRDYNGLSSWRGLIKTLRFGGVRLSTVDLLGAPDYQFRMRRNDACTLSLIAESCPNLEVLKAEYIPTNIEDIYSFADNCKKLKHLVLRYSFGLQDIHLSNIIYHCPLQILDITGCKGIKGQFFIQPNDIQIVTLDGCSGLSIKDWHNKKTNLKKLSYDNFSAKRGIRIISNCSATTIESMNIKKSQTLSLNDMTCFKELKSLTISKWLIGKLGATSDSFQNFVTVFEEQLEALHIVSCFPCSYNELPDFDNILTANTILMHIAKLRKLRELTFKSTEVVSDLNLMIWSQKLTELRKLSCISLPRITDAGAASMLQHCKKLEWFDLSYCKMISKETLQNANFDVLRRTSNSPHLTLTLTGTNVVLHHIHNIVTTPHLHVVIKNQF